MHFLPVVVIVLVAACGVGADANSAEFVAEFKRCEFDGRPGMGRCHPDTVPEVKAGIENPTFRETLLMYKEQCTVHGTNWWCIACKYRDGSTTNACPPDSPE
jgi:hypothetical protein